MGKTLKMGKIVFVAAVIGMLTLGALVPENVFAGGMRKWYGIITTPTIPWDGVKITDCGTMVEERDVSTGPAEGFMRDTTMRIDKMENELKQSAISAGYNAIVGYRIEVSQSVVPYVQNGNLYGGGGCVIIEYGTPVLVEKK